MDEGTQEYQPLLTAVNPLPVCEDFGTGAQAGQDPLPSGLGVLVRAGASFRRALLLSLALCVVSLAELAVLLLYPGPEVAVVWEEKSSRLLVEVP